MRSILLWVSAALLSGMVPYVAAGEAAPELPVLSVSGRGEASAAPDIAVVRLGAVAQDKSAGAAQANVGRVMEEAIRSLRGLGVEERRLSTRDLTLAPVFSDGKRMAAGDSEDPRIIGYRAANVLEVRVEDLKLLGKIVDAGVNAGANRLEGPYFQILDDIFVRESALVRAVENAQRKADAIVAAMRMRLGPVLEVIESGVYPIQPMERGFRTLAVETGTPVQSGEIRVEAQVTVRYRIVP
jgi:uncharacterized protein